MCITILVLSILYSKKQQDNTKTSLKCPYNPLDATLIHPESYDLIERVLACQAFSLVDIGTEKLAHRFREKNAKMITITKFAMDDVAMKAKLEQIVDALAMDPDADIRCFNANQRPLLRSAAITMDSLVVDQVLNGVVKNVTHFGAFIDLGVGKDALLHINQFDRLIKGCGKDQGSGECGGDKTKIDGVRLGQRLKVRVIDLERGRERINLSLA